MKTFAIVALVLLVVGMAACAKTPAQPTEQLPGADVNEPTAGQIAPNIAVDDTAVTDVEGDLTDLETIDQSLDTGDLDTLEQDLGQI